MKISEMLEYDAAPDAVFEMLSDPAYQERKCVEAGAVRHSVSVAPQGGGVHIVTTRELPTDDLPDFAKSLVGPRLQTTETWSWRARGADGGRDGQLHVEVAGAPVSMRAIVRLTPSAQSSSLTVVGDLKASVPLVGGKIEKAAAPAVVNALRSEGATGRRWLAGSA